MTIKLQSDHTAKGILLLSAQSMLMLLTTSRNNPFLRWTAGLILFSAILYRLPVTIQNLLVFIKDPWNLAGGMALGILLGYVFFYSTWLRSDFFQRLPAARLITLGCMGILWLLSVPFLTCVIGWCVQSIKKEYQSLPTEKGISLQAGILILFSVYAVGLLAILRADFNYIDDLGRVLLGYKEWSFFSRYLSMGLSSVIHMGNYLTDVSPLPQLLAAGIMACSGMMLLCAVYQRKCFSFWELVSVVPLALNPYFLECLSYKYDAPYMALSVFGGIFPILFHRKRPELYGMTIVLGTLIVCTTYQAASGIFPMLVVLLALRRWKQGEDIPHCLWFCIHSALYYGIGLVLFRMLILRPEETYAGNMTSLGAMLPTFLTNILAYYQLVIQDFKRFWLGLVGLLAAAFLMKNAAAGRRKYLAFGLTLLSELLLFLLAFGVYPALADASFDPRAMYGFGFLLTLLGISVAEGKGSPVVKLIPVTLAWTFFVFSFTYGDALQAQKEYTNFRIQMVLDDLNGLELLQREEPVKLEVTGEIGRSPILENMPEDGNILNRLVPDTFSGNWMWGQYQLQYYYKLNTIWEEGTITDASELPNVEEKLFHTLRYSDTCVQVELKE